MTRLKSFDPLKAIAAPGSAQSGGVLTIDLQAIRENYTRLCQEVGPTVEVAAAVKADAYGLGVARVAPILSSAGCERFFVATRDEALSLRHFLKDCRTRHGKPPSIHLLNGVFSHNDAALHQAGISPVINSLEQLALWKADLKAGRPHTPCVLQLDSGMSRYGLSPADVAELVAQPDRLSGVPIDLVLSHLAQADARGSPTNAAQREQFNAMRAAWAHLPASLAASSGIFLGSDYHFNLVRPGYALYGGNPTPGKVNPMRDVVSLYARIIQVRDINIGDLVGYGGVFCAQRPSRIATVAVGYADGIPRHAGGKICVAHLARPDIPLPVIGRLSMDSMAVDVTDLPADIPLDANTFFEVFGPNRLLDDVARDIGTIGYELLTSIGARFHRVYLEDQS